MAITRHFKGVEIKFPSGSGPVHDKYCEKCDTQLYGVFGADKNGKFQAKQSCPRKGCDGVKDD